MKDPVILPSSRIIVDRPVIQRHLLSDPLLFPNPLDIRSQIVTPFFIFSIIELAISVASSPEGSGDGDEASRGRRCRWVSFAKRKGGVGDPEQNIDSLKERWKEMGLRGCRRKKKRWEALDWWEVGIIMDRSMLICYWFRVTTDINPKNIDRL
ncbi:hypothetical protein Lser_V15G37107 [Lactuca serriola]